MKPRSAGDFYVMRPRTLAVARTAGVSHIVVAWALLLLGFAVPGFVGFFVAAHYSGPLLESGTLLVAVVIVASAAISVVGVTLFAAAWFMYLRYCVGIERTAEVESRLKAFMQIGLMEPIYSKVKKLVYGSSTHDA